MCGKGKSFLGGASLIVLAMCLSPAFANPEGAIVVHGDVSLKQAPKTLDIYQKSNKAVVDWRKFDVEVDETTNFHQPSNKSIILNRVKSNDPSKILGAVNANGNVVLVNPNGVLFGKDSKVDVNGLVATTSDIDNKAFLQKDKLRFDKPGKPTPPSSIKDASLPRKPV